MKFGKIVRTSVINATLLGAAACAQASPTSTTIGTINALGTDYTVSLLYDSVANYSDQSFDALSPLLTFSTEAEAHAAADALMSTFGANYTWNPAAGSGSGVRIPFAVGGGTYDYLTIYGGLVNGPFNRPTNAGNGFSFAQFTAAVPEPETYAMLLAGLGVLGFMGKRRKTQ